MPPLWIVLAAVFIDLLGYGLVIPLLPIAITRFGGSATLVGVLIAGYALLQGICGPLLGAISDRLGRRPVLLVCLCGTCIGYLLLGLAHSLEMLAIALLVDAVTGANLSTAQAYVADSTTPANRTRAFGLVGVAFALGVTAGPALGGGLSGLGTGVPALIAAALAFLNCVLMFAMLPESLPAEQRLQVRIQITSPLIFLRHGMALRRVLIPILCANLAFAGLQSIFPIFSHARFGWDASTNGLFFACVGVCAILTQAFLIGKLRTRFSDPQLARLGAGLSLLLPILAFVPASWMLYPLAALVAIGSNLCIPALASLLAERTNTHTYGRSMGLQQFTINAALIAGPLLSGFAYDQLGPAAPFVLGGVWAAIGMMSVPSSA